MSKNLECPDQTAWIHGQILAWVVSKSHRALIVHCASYISYCIYPKYLDTLTLYLGQVVQSFISLTSSLVVKTLTVLGSTISNSQVFLLKKCECKSYLHFFSKNISVYAISNDQSLNDTLSNDIVSFEQVGPDIFVLNCEHVHFTTYSTYEGCSK